MPIPNVLIDACLSGRCILFVGSGASRQADAPSWERLLQDIASRFCPQYVERVEKYFARNDPWGAADLVCSAAPAPELNTYVRNRLERLEPSPAHKLLTKLPWAAIYTTNYDLLLEKAYEIDAGERAQTPVPVYQFSTDFNIHENSRVHLFKLHGSIDQIHQRQNVLVLTTKDVTDTHNARIAMLEHIPRLLLDYYWVFVGYSFSDGVLRQLLAEIKRSNRDVMPRESFVILPSITEEDSDLFRQYKINHIAMSFGDFMSALDDTRQREARGRLRVRRVEGKVVSGGIEMDFPAATRVVMDDQFEIVEPAAPNGDARDFYLGGEPSWGNLEAAVDYRRDELVEAIKKSARSALAAAPLKALVLVGAAGSGKSTLLRRVGYEIATASSEAFPVVRLREFFAAGNRYSESWDVRLISEVSRAARNAPVLILVDNLEVRYRAIRNLYSALREHNIRATIIAGARALDWSNLIDEHPMPGFTVHQVPDDIQAEQVSPFVRYLQRRGLVNIDYVTTAEYWEQAVASHHDHHLLGVMRSLSTSTEEAFDDKIISEYENLPDLARRAYETVCLTNQFGYPISLDLLLIVLNCSHPEFGEEVLQKDKDHVIIRRVETISGRVAYHARHRIIAEIIARHRWPNPYELCDAIVSLFERFNAQSEDEYRLCRSLLMSHEVRDRLPEITYRRRMFDTALNIFGDDDVVYQHYAMAEMDAGEEPNFQRAHDLLSKAQMAPGASRNPTIQHTRGMLYLRQAGASTDSGRKRSYERKAEQEFIEYRKKDRGSEYGYYTHARMLQRQRQELLASQNPEENEGARLLARALQIVREGLEAVDDADLARLPLIEADLLREISPAKALKKLDEWISLNATPDAYYLRAAVRMQTGQIPDSRSDVDEGLKIAPDHRGLLVLRVRLLKEAGGYHTKDLLNAVRAAMLHAPDSPKLAFEAAVTAFHLNMLDQARDYFKRAYATAGRAGRPRAFYIKTNEQIEFHRRLEALAAKFARRVPDSSEPGLEEISGVLEGGERPSLLRRDGYGDQIFVRHQDVQPWMKAGMPVVANVAFNYFGPLALNIRKRK